MGIPGNSFLSRGCLTVEFPLRGDHSEPSLQPKSLKLYIWLTYLIYLHPPSPFPPTVCYSYLLSSFKLDCNLSGKGTMSSCVSVQPHAQKGPVPEWDLVALPLYKQILIIILSVQMKAEKRVKDSCKIPSKAAECNRARFFSRTHKELPSSH